MIGPGQAMVILLSVPAATLLAALVCLQNQRAERFTRLVLLVVALAGAVAVRIGAGARLTDLTPLATWLPGAVGAPVAIGVHLDATSLSLVTAIALLTLVTMASLPPGWRRSETALLLVASTAAHVASMGDHLLMRLAAIEVLLLSVLLLMALARSGSLVGLLVTQRLAVAAVLLGGLLVGWQDAASRLPGILVEHRVYLLLLAALALGGGLPFHRSLRSLASQPAAVRAHVSALLALVSGGLVMHVTDQIELTGVMPVTVGLVISAVLAASLSLAAQDPQRSQLWMWASQLGLALAFTVHVDPATAVASWVCLALVRPAAAHSIDIVVKALGEGSFAARRWGGLASVLPAASWLGVVAAVAVAGLPPFGLFAGLANLATRSPVTPATGLSLAAATICLALPALRLGLWPFVGAARGSVLAPREQTRVQASLVVVVAVCAVVGLLWPLGQLIFGFLPSTPVLAACTAATLALVGLSLLLGRRRPEDAADASLPGWRLAFDDGLPFPSQPTDLLRRGLRQWAWSVNLLGLLPVGMSRLLCGFSWLAAWVESRPLWWAGLCVAGLAAVVLLGGGW